MWPVGPVREGEVLAEVQEAPETWDIEADVVIMGSGAAGACAATEAARAVPAAEHAAAAVPGR